MMGLRLACWAMVGFGFFGCSSLTSHRNDAALVKVKRVAVAGFSVVSPVPNGLRESTQTGIESAQKMYDGLARSVGKNMKWEVLALDKMRSNPTYRKLYDKTMKGWQNKVPMPEGAKQLVLDGVMDSDCLRILGADGRTELAQALGVDAVVTSRVQVLLNANTVMGIGSRYPQSRISLSLFTKNADTPDWFEGGIDGKVAETSVGKTAFFDEPLLHKLALESARTAFSNLGKTNTARN